MRTAVGLLALGIAGGVVPVGLSVAAFFTPVLMGTVAAFLILLALGLVGSVLSRRRSRGLVPMSSRLAPLPDKIVRSARHITT